MKSDPLLHAQLQRVHREMHRLRAENEQLADTARDLHRLRGKRADLS